MENFAQKLHIAPGVTAIIGSGGKTTLLYRLAEELSSLGSVIVATSTHIFRPKHLPFAEKTGKVRGVLCVGTPGENGKITAPAQSFAELENLADFVLVEADGSKKLPLKAHAAHEPVIPSNARQVICVVGASGLNLPVCEVVHRPEVFTSITGSEIATPQAVAEALKQEGFCTRVLINQAETNGEAARELANALDCPTTLASLEKGEIICSF